MNKKYDIIFLGLAKNVTKTINAFFLSLENISKQNLKLCIIIGENDSTDGSSDYLKNYSNDKFDYIYLETTFLRKYKNRIIRLGYGRQYLKDYILKNKFSSQFIVVVDLDEVIINGIETIQLLNNFKILEDKKNYLFGVSSKSRPYYYDLLPLIIKDYYEIDVYKIQTKVSLKAFYERNKFIYDFQKKISKMRDVDTKSSHNGLTIYLYKDYLLGNYFVSEKNIRSEHINFNSEIHKKTGKYIRMTNSLIVNTPQEHMPLTFKEFFVQKIMKFLKLN
ncbi:hypothetical protein [Candidatus Pelagibacter sp. HIMB1521]|uniref:hypothetical protein n=1 Tax=Candidatus Pelagibacter sp. HIMB1521 TaxID=3413344 RepID=UPI003F87A5A9